MSVHKIILFAATLVLASCGFEPLYGPQSHQDGVGVESRLASIKIAHMPERTGQIFRNHLLDKLNPSGEPRDPQAYLDVSFDMVKTSTSMRRDGTVQRFNITATATVILRDSYNRKVLYTDVIKRTTSFAIGDVTAEFAYAGTISEKDAKRRVLLLLADDLHLMLATYYKKLTQPVTQPPE